MKTFALTRATDSAQAIASAAKATTAQQGAEIRFIGGGTTLIDLMKLNVEQPQTLVDINRLPLDKIEALPDGGLTIGAVVRNSDLAYVRQMLAGEISHYSLVKRNLRKDGSVVWINLTVSLVRHPSGEPKYFISVVEDISVKEDVFRRAEETPAVAEQAVAVGAKVLWLQDGIVNHETGRIAEEGGVEVVMGICMMREHERLEG